MLSAFVSNARLRIDLQVLIADFVAFFRVRIVLLVVYFAYIKDERFTISLTLTRCNNISQRIFV